MTNHRLALVFALAASLFPVAGRHFALAAPPSRNGAQQEIPLFGSSAKELAARRAQLRELLKDGIVIIPGEPGAGDIERTRYRTNNSTVYLTGVESPDSILVLLPDGDPSGKKEIMFLQPQSPGERNWNDPLHSPGTDTEGVTGLQSTMPLREFWVALKPSLTAATKVYIEGQIGDAAKYTKTGEYIAKIKEINPNITVANRELSRAMTKLRYIKSPSEVANMRATIRATGLAQRNAAKRIRPGITELTVEGAILDGFRSGGAVGDGFPSIVGSGPNSNTLHHFSSSRVMQSGELVVCDIGSEYNYYSADVTRTYPVNGKFTPRQREVYQLVLDVQTACQKMVVPGKTSLGEMHQFAVSMLRKSPLRAKDASGTERTMDRFFIHGLGHSLGLDVHDVTDSGGILKPGVVFTIEPGIYLRNEGFGIRIEDDYLITETGCEKLSEGIPYTVDAIEAAMKSQVRLTAATPRPSRRNVVVAKRPGSSAQQSR